MTKSQNQSRNHSGASAAMLASQKRCPAYAAQLASHAAAGEEQQPGSSNGQRSANQLHGRFASRTKSGSTTGAPSGNTSRSPALSDVPSFGQWRTAVEEPAGQTSARLQGHLATATRSKSVKQGGNAAPEQTLPRQPTSQVANQRSVTIASWPPGKLIVCEQRQHVTGTGGQSGSAAHAKTLSGARPTEDGLQQVHKTAAGSSKKHAARVPTGSALQSHEQGNVVQKTSPAPTTLSGSQVPAPLSAAQLLQYSTEPSLLPKPRQVVNSLGHSAPVSSQLGSDMCTQHVATHDSRQQVDIAAHGSKQQVASAIGSHVPQHMQPRSKSDEEVNGCSHWNGRPGSNSPNAELSRQHAVRPAEPAGHAVLQTAAAELVLPTVPANRVDHAYTSGQHWDLHGKANRRNKQPESQPAKYLSLNEIWARQTANATPAKPRAPAQAQGPLPPADAALSHRSRSGDEEQSKASGEQSKTSDACKAQSDASEAQSEAPEVQSEASGVHAFEAERLSREKWHEACFAADSARASAALGMLTAMEGRLL